MGRVVDNGLDANRVLEHGKNAADGDGNEGRRLRQLRPRRARFGRVTLDNVLEHRVGLVGLRTPLCTRYRRRGALGELSLDDAIEDGGGFVGLALPDEEARRLGKEEDAKAEGNPGDGAEGQHPSPLVRQSGEGKVGAVCEEDAHGEGDFGEGDERAAEGRRGDLRDEHGGDEKASADAKPLDVTAQKEIPVARCEGHGKGARGEGERRDEERGLTAELVGDHPRAQRAHHRRRVDRRREDLFVVRVETKVLGNEEEDSRDDANVVAEKQRIERRKPSAREHERRRTCKGDATRAATEAGQRRVHLQVVNRQSWLPQRWLWNSALWLRTRVEAARSAVSRAKEQQQERRPGGEAWRPHFV